jgi:DNA-binding SARP family transcriptional activator
MRASRHGEKVHLGPPKQRAVLGLLASRVNDIVAFEEIVDAVWGSDVPQTAANGVHTYIAGLRRVLEPARGRRESGEVLVKTSGGYALFLPRESIDVERFVGHLAQGRQLAGERDPHGAAEQFGLALRLWRGEAYGHVPGPFAAAERNRLHQLRLAALEEWATVMLALGRHTELVDVLRESATREPLHEKLGWLLMLTLCRCGRQAEALDVYRTIRQLLSEELGLEPGPELRVLHERILAGDADLAVPAGMAVATEVPPMQLPARVRDFVGRYRELAMLRQFVEAEQARQGAATTMAVLEGGAGIGKTAVALEVAYELADRFPHGQLFIDLCGFSPQRPPLSPAWALAILLASLGVPEDRIPAGRPGRAGLYRSLVHRKRILLVLDDAVDAEQVRPLIPTGPACVLVTSRCRQSGLVVREGAYRLGLGPSGLEESVKLLARVAGPARMPSRAEADQLVQWCGHLPQALRIAAEALAAAADLSVADLLRMGRGVSRLDWLDQLAQLAGSTASMRTALTMSYRSLPPDAARAFRLLGGYPGAAVSLPAAAELVGVDQGCADRQLTQLANRHLLDRVGQDLYRLPPLVDVFAAECAEDGGAAGARHRASSLTG